MNKFYPMNHALMFKKTVLFKKTVMASLLLVSLIGLTACQKKPSESDSSTNQPMQTLPQQTTLQNQPQSAQAMTGQVQVSSVKANYSLPACDGEGCPQVDIQRLETSQPWINQFLDQQILKLSNVQLSEKTNKLTTLQANVDRFVAAAKADSAARQTPVPYSMQVSPKFLGEVGDVARFKISAAFYTGGAHGSALDNYYNLDMQRKKQLVLADILMPQQQQALYDLVHQQYVQWVKRTAAGTDMVQYEKDWPFKLTQNFSLGDEGLLLAYGQYEIGPYVVGMPEFIIPYAQLSGILKPEYLPVAPDVSSTTTTANPPTAVSK